MMVVAENYQAKTRFFLGTLTLTLSFLVFIVVAIDEQVDPSTSSSSSPTTTTTTSADGRLFKADDNILTPSGEVPIDFESGKKLPEELNDGELEAGDQHSGWTYSKQNFWAVEYPQCKGVNLRQSPIDIETDRVQFNPRMKLEFVDYDQEVEFEVKNTHHSVSLTPIASVSPPLVKLNWVPGDLDEFQLQEIHFHWGDGINKGSEHEINDQRAAAEMHMVHYRRGIDKADIGHTENSVVVVGVLIESDAIEHHKLESLVRKTEKVNGTDMEYIDDKPENLINLLPNNHHSFYTYNGSLTTPPCYEVVTWVIMSEPVFMEQERLVELSNFEALNPLKKQRQKISSNRRDIQPLLNRPVYASFNTTDSLTTDTSKQTGGKFATNGRFSKAFSEYWGKVNSLRTSVRRAFRAIEMARQRLRQQLGLYLTKPGGKPQQQQQPTPTDETKTTTAATATAAASTVDCRRQQ